MQAAPASVSCAAPAAAAAAAALVAALAAAPAAPGGKASAEALHRLEATEAPRSAAEAAAAPGFGLEVRRRPEAPAGDDAVQGKGRVRAPGGLMSREELAVEHATTAAAAARTVNIPGGAGGAASAEAQLAMDLALLQGARLEVEDQDEGGKPGRNLSGDTVGEDGVWRPPQGQSGDGRTTLNDLLGY